MSRTTVYGKNVDTFRGYTADPCDICGTSPVCHTCLYCKKCCECPNVVEGQLEHERVSKRRAD